MQTIEWFSELVGQAVSPAVTLKWSPLHCSAGQIGNLPPIDNRCGRLKAALLQAKPPAPPRNRPPAIARLEAALYLLLLSPCLLAQGERPLTALPYTPSLDPAAMDRTVDPCADFYRYACGNWIKNNPIPADQSRWDVYGKMTDENQRFLWGILEEAAKFSSRRTQDEQKIGDYFAACMNESAIEKAGLEPFQKTINLIGSLQDKRQLAPVIARLHTDFRSSVLFAFGSNQDFADSTNVIAFAEAGGLGLPDRDYYTKTDAKSVETRTKYLAHVQLMLELVGDSPDTAKAAAQSVMDLETELAKASLTRVEKRDPYKLFHKMSRAELIALTPSFDWGTYLAASGVAQVSTFNVSEPEFYKKVEDLIKSRDVPTWKTYLRWHAVRDAARYLPSRFETADFEFRSRHLRGIQEMPPRWKRCVRLVDHNLGEALGKVFVTKTFGPDTKARALAMTGEIERAMDADLHEIPWMSAETKKQALEKLHTIVNKIGNPDKWRDYSSLIIVQGRFLDNVEASSRFERRRELAKIGKPVDRGEWLVSPPTVDAYYDPQMNDINFPAGVLQPPLFDAKMDDAPNYGNTGATIGHELTHGFDDEGRQFDAHGNLRDWWTEKDAAEFSKRADCVADQYAQYKVVDDIKINSRLTLGEDVADLGGTRLAFIAWKHATAGRQLEPKDGLTPEQRFFVGMGQWACGDERPESKRLNAITNPHSPLEYRINGVVSNMPQFSEAFSCKPGQPMVRAQVCRVW
jgi:endothelin-converting enzyme/putative endopeptidase